MDGRSLKRFDGDDDDDDDADDDDDDDDAGKQPKRWKAWAMAKIATMKDLKKEQRAPWVLTLLDGSAWECCEH